MAQGIQYAGVCIIDATQKYEIAVETISVTPDSCELTGAWIFPLNETKNVLNVAHGKLIVFLGEDLARREVLGELAPNEVNIEDFLAEARFEADQAAVLHSEYMKQNAIEYAAYMAVKPVERKLLQEVKKKTLVAPNLNEWPEKVDLSSARATLQSWNLLAEIQSTPSNMLRVLAASRLLKRLIDMWRFDEIERCNRLYITDKNSEISVLPLSWIIKLGNVQKG